MKSSTVWHGHSTQPSLPAGTARKDSGSLPHGRQNRLILQPKKNRKFPLGNSLLYISLSYVDFSGCVRRAHPVFYFVLNLLTHGSQPYFSNILPARRLESNLHNAILFGIRRAFPDLAFDGFFALIVAGIAGVDYSGHRRASLRSVWGWM